MGVLAEVQSGVDGEQWNMGGLLDPCGWRDCLYGELCQESGHSHSLYLRKKKGALAAASDPFRVRRVFSVGKPLSDQRNKCERNDFD